MVTDWFDNDMTDRCQRSQKINTRSECINWYKVQNDILTVFNYVVYNYAEVNNVIYLSPLFDNNLLQGNPPQCSFMRRLHYSGPGVIVQ